MKKTFSLSILMGFWVALSASAQEAPSGVLSNAGGTVTVMRQGTEIPASSGTELLAGDILLTGVDGQADVVLNGLAGIRFLGTTEGTLVRTQKENMGVHVTTGNVILNLKDLPPGAAFELATLTAIAAVRGTQFWGRVNAPAGMPVTTIAVREGTVNVTAKESGAAFELKEGEALDIPTGAAAPAVRPALEEEMAAMAQASEIL